MLQPDRYLLFLHPCQSSAGSQRFVGTLRNEDGTEVEIAPRARHALERALTWHSKLRQTASFPRTELEKTLRLTITQLSAVVGRLIGTLTCLSDAKAISILVFIRIYNRLELSRWVRYV
jgi:hypothetical protein